MAALESVILSCTFDEHKKRGVSITNILGVDMSTEIE